MRRRRERLELRRNPLVLVLCQVRFTPVLSLEERIPGIQEEFRSLGYPRFQALQSQEVDLTSPPVPAPWSSLYHFLDRDSRSAFVVGVDSLSYEVTSYTQFEPFLDRFLDGLALLTKALGPLLLEKLGLRYLDVIQGRETETLSDWLQPGLLGVVDLPLVELQTRFELRGKTDSTQVLVRATRPAAGFVPADLQPLQIQIELAEPLRSGQYVVLDLDHSKTISTDLSRAVVEDGLWELHDLLDLAFRASVTPRALEAWR